MSKRNTDALNATATPTINYDSFRIEIGDTYDKEIGVVIVRVIASFSVAGYFATTTNQLALTCSCSDECDDTDRSSNTKVDT